MTSSKSLYTIQRVKRFAWWYLGSFVVICMALLGMLYYYGLSHEEVIEHYPRGVAQLMRSWMFWITLSIPYFLFLLFKKLYRRYRQGGLISMGKTIMMWIIIPILSIVVLYRASQSYLKYEDFDYKWERDVENHYGKITNRFCHDSKQRGAHVFGGLDSTRLAPLIRNNFEWITLVPYGGQDNYDSSIMRGLSTDSTRQNKSDSMWINRISEAHEAGFRVMLKPHIWLSAPSGGKWRSDIYPKSDADWKLWSEAYEDFILHYATLAEQTGVELLCIGTEFSKLALLKPDFWISLIHQVRSKYSGELTYAANWNNEYDQITFWNSLDYIGIQAYFPLAQTRNPSTTEIAQGWSDHMSTMDSLSIRYGRPILFTELGYKSTTDAAIRPWAWSSIYANLFQRVSTKVQHNCYQAFFETVWQQDWFAGAHIWQWRSNHDRAGGTANLNFTPQGKPAENVLAKGFSQ